MRSVVLHSVRIRSPLVRPVTWLIQLPGMIIASPAKVCDILLSPCPVLRECSRLRPPRAYGAGTTGPVGRDQCTSQGSSPRSPPARKCIGELAAASIANTGLCASQNLGQSSMPQCTCRRGSAPTRVCRAVTAARFSFRTRASTGTSSDKDWDRIRPSERTASVFTASPGPSAAEDMARTRIQSRSPGGGARGHRDSGLGPPRTRPCACGCTNPCAPRIMGKSSSHQCSCSRQRRVFPAAGSSFLLK